MQKLTQYVLPFLLISRLLCSWSSAEQISDSVTVEYGAINSIAIRSEAGTVSVYGLKQGSASHVLLTHHRRDVLADARRLIQDGSKAIAPAAERDLIESPEKFWNEFPEKRFHDYAQQSRKILETGLKVSKWVKEGDSIELEGLRFQVVETPGFTRGAVSYLASIDGKRVAFTGDLVYGPGQILDLYSFQDAIPERPGAYHMPAMTHTPIQNIHAVKDGKEMRWKEYELTFRFYPGQTIYHGGLLVKRGKETPVFFIGDAFSPSGMDDYCLLNRNLLHKDQGYRKCLKMIRDLGANYWLINEHIPHVFRFSDTEMTYLESRFNDRIDTIGKLIPWDDPNYAVDEQWAVCYPYGTQTRPGTPIRIQVRLTNHSQRDRTYRVSPRCRQGLKINENVLQIQLKAGQSAAVTVEGQTTSQSGVFIVTADVESGDMKFRDWVEAIVVVK